MKKIQRSIIFVIGILLWVMQGQSVFAAGSTELLSGTIANTTISYRLTEDGTLTIYSDNIEEMPNYTVNSTVPWAAQKDKIKKVQINSYLKNIGDYAFYGCDSLESVVIQDSKLTEIGIAAFKNCKNLKTINIPETVKAIGTMGFANCNSLQSTKKNPVVIPKGNTEIMDFAFAGCKSMQYIKIPASVEMIGNCAFFECDFLSEIEIEEGQLQEIGDYAFTDCEMESIVIPTKTGKIGEYAFSDCKRLEKIWFLYANGTDTQEIAGNMLQGSSHVNTGIITACSSALIGVVWALINMRYTNKSVLENEKRRAESYLGYIEKQRNRIRVLKEELRQSMIQMYPDTKQCLQYSVQAKELWTRNREHKDFLTERIGLGAGDISNYIEIPKERFEVVEDELNQKPYQLKKEEAMLPGIPKTIDLSKEGIVGIVGNKEVTLNIARILITQIAANNCYTDVRLAFVYDENKTDEWKCYGMLPHVWSAGYRVRYMASDPIEAEEVFLLLEEQLKEEMLHKEDAAFITKTGRGYLQVGNDEL